MFNEQMRYKTECGGDDDAAAAAVVEVGSTNDANGTWYLWSSVKSINVNLTENEIN